ncbi:hypothetical protein BMS3Bbin04_01385 [bacterium BMS3Bbin04]|nr:hypothetical protein BMS3Bbin04_01385 [bacterium BMS3Bbin04]
MSAYNSPILVDDLPGPDLCYTFCMSGTQMFVIATVNEAYFLAVWFVRSA